MTGRRWVVWLFVVGCSSSTTINNVMQSDGGIDSGVPSPPLSPTPPNKEGGVDAGTDTGPGVDSGPAPYCSGAPASGPESINCFAYGACVTAGCESGGVAYVCTDPGGGDAGHPAGLGCVHSPGSAPPGNDANCCVRACVRYEKGDIYCPGTKYLSCESSIDPGASCTKPGFEVSAGGRGYCCP